MRTLCHLLVLVLVGCGGGAGPSVDAAAIHQASEDYRSALNAGDTTAIFALLTDDLEVFPPGAEPQRGAAAHDLFRGMLAQATATLAPFRNEEIDVSGNLAVQRYSFELTVQPKTGGVAVTTRGSGLHIWRRGADGQWRLARDIWTTPIADSAR